MYLQKVISRKTLKKLVFCVFLENRLEKRRIRYPGYRWVQSRIKMSGIRNNYLCTYDLYSPVHIVLDACISITRASGRGYQYLQNPYLHNTRIEERLRARERRESSSIFVVSEGIVGGGVGDNYYNKRSFLYFFSSTVRYLLYGYCLRNCHRVDFRNSNA